MGEGFSIAKKGYCSLKKLFYFFLSLLFFSNAVVAAELVPLRPMEVGVKITLKEGWHTYGKTPGSAGAPPTFKWTLPSGFDVQEMEWPIPKKIEESGITVYGYEHEVIFPFRIIAPATATGSIPVKVAVDYLVCEKVCVPEHADLSLQLRIEKVKSPFLIYIAFAFLGGLILNLMPCVFPVLSLKILNFVKESKKRGVPLWHHGLAFSAGILVSFWVLAGTLLVTRAAGMQLGWGFQLQSPVILVVLSFLFFLFSLNLLGFFEIGASLTRFAHPEAGSFLSGVLATVVATPCTAPFMGTAIGFALTQGTAGAITIFSALALGLSFPYLLLSFFPALLRKLPKPGHWMVTLRQFLAFPLLATVIWLAWVLSVQTHSATSLWIGLLGAAFGVWLLRFRKWLGFIIIVLSFAHALYYASPSKTISTIPWEPYSEVRLEQALHSGRPVFIDFTAAWCLSCQVNERVAFSSTEVQRLFKSREVIALKADWTSKNKEITDALGTYGRNSVPLYIYYDPSCPGQPMILPELLTPKIILEALTIK